MSIYRERGVEVQALRVNKVSAMFITCDIGGASRDYIQCGNITFSAKATNTGKRNELPACAATKVILTPPPVRLRNE